METPCIEGGFQEVKYPELKQIDFSSDGSQFNQGFDAKQLRKLAVSFACHQESGQQDDDAWRHGAVSPVAMREQEIFLHQIQQYKHQDTCYLDDGGNVSRDLALHVLPPSALSDVIKNDSRSKIQQPNRWKLIQQVHDNERGTYARLGRISAHQFYSQQYDDTQYLPSKTTSSQCFHQHWRHQVEEEEVTQEPAHGVEGKVIVVVRNPCAGQSQLCEKHFQVDGIGAPDIPAIKET